MKIRLLGSADQTKGLVAPGMLLSLRILRLNIVPDPLSGVRSSEKADTRKVFIVPGPELIILAETLHWLPVSPNG